MIIRRVRSILSLFIILGLVLGAWPFGIQVSKAQSLALCNLSSHGTSHFTLLNGKITHDCGTGFRQVTYSFVGQFSALQLGTIDSTGHAYDLASYKDALFGAAYNSEKKFGVYKLNLDAKLQYFLVIDIDDIPARTVFGLWIDDTENALYSTFYSLRRAPLGSTLYDPTKVKFYNIVNTLTNKAGSQLIEKEKADLAGYLKYIRSKSTNRDYWTIDNKNTGSGLGGNPGCAHGVDYYYDSANGFFPSNVPDTDIKLTNPATITIPVKNGENAKFTYKYYMHWGSGSRRDNWYYYFLAPQSSNYCNLAIRFADGGKRGADVVAINLARVGSLSENEQGVFELGSRTIANLASFGCPGTGGSYVFACFNISESSFENFIKKLYGGKTSGDITTIDKKIKTGEDELGGVFLLSGNNPAASGTPTDPCKAGFGFLEFVGKAFCRAGFAFASFAATLAGITFEWLKSAAGLQ